MTSNISNEVSLFMFGGRDLPATSGNLQPPIWILVTLPSFEHWIVPQLHGSGSVQFETPRLFCSACMTCASESRFWELTGGRRQRMRVVKQRRVGVKGLFILGFFIVLGLEEIRVWRHQCLMLKKKCFWFLQRKSETMSELMRRR